jgi:anti-sigma regulatory factor (Ser/Thr protein kinase)
MREIALHLLDIAENSVAAQSRNICMAVYENLQSDLLLVSVADDGRGMSEKTAQQVLDPFYTTRTTRKVGLGIPLLKLAAEMSEGELNLITEQGKGTKVTASFRHSHIDRMPLGDLSMTFLTLLISYPHIHWVFIYQITDRLGQIHEFNFDDCELKETLDNMSMTEPSILKFVRSMLEEGIKPLALQAAN